MNNILKVFNFLRSFYMVSRLQIKLCNYNQFKIGNIETWVQHVVRLTGCKPAKLSFAYLRLSMAASISIG